MPLGEITYVVARHAHYMKERWLMRELERRGMEVHEALAEGFRIITDLHTECHGWGVRIVITPMVAKLELCDCLRLDKAP